MPRLLLALLLLLAAALPAAAQGRDREPRGEPGRFDYWLLSLSWSPTHCAEEGRDDGTQCAPGRRFGFVVHGLWPQWERGSWPQFCAAERGVPRPVEDAMLPIMPSRGLIEHQWTKHGSCSGLGVEGYFARTREAKARVRIPNDLQAPDRPLNLTATEVERLFAAANPGLDPDEMAVVCRGRQFAEIRICLGDKLGFRRCGRGVDDRCGQGEAQFRPVR